MEFSHIKPAGSATEPVMVFNLTYLEHESLKIFREPECVEKAVAKLMLPFVAFLDARLRQLAERLDSLLQKSEDKSERSDITLLAFEELARVLNVDRSTLYKWHKSGRLGPLPLRIGKVARFDANEIERWIAAGCPGRAKWQDMRDEHKER